MGKFNGFQIKLFMAMLMILDHLSYIHGLIPPNMVSFFHLITRCVGAWFAYIMVEGFLHTRNRLIYNGRLFLWAGIMFVGNTLLTSLLSDTHISNNIFFTLALGALMLNVMSIKSHRNSRLFNSLLWMFKIIVVTLIILFGCLFAEGGTVLLPFVLITYGFRDKIKIRNTLYVLWSLILFSSTLSSVIQFGDLYIILDMMMFNSEWFFISVLPFIYLYNRKRGRNDKFSKYFFYVFYPLHLWIIVLINYFITH